MNCVCALIICFLCIFVSSLLKESNAATPENDHDVYIVYMGAAAASGNGSPRDDHLQLMSTLTTRKKDAVLHNYRHGFTGFSARLSKEEAILIAQEPGVVSVFPDRILKLHTTHSWDFLKYQSDIKSHSDSHPRLGSSHSKNRGDVIVGVFDTGIWPESKSFSDNDIGAIPPRWKGKCMEGKNFTSSNCNRKLIGARYYDNLDTPRDEIGHGTHISSTIAGSPVSGASYHGVGEGIAKGGSPGSRIAMYRVCDFSGCNDSTVLKAFDDAIRDGVDMISLSMGSGTDPVPFSADPIAIGSFHAVEKGITVVCSAGNDGPRPKTVANVAPWILTVAATTMDRYFQVDVLLGNNKTIKGGGMHYGEINKSPVYPLIYDNSDKSKARDGNTGSSNLKKPKGGITVSSKIEDIDTITATDGVGLILILDIPGSVAYNTDTFPLAVVSSKDGDEILSYIKSSKNPTATILPTVTVTNYKPAPVVADFSSRGPSIVSRNIIKPDIAAPGVDILAAWPEKDINGSLFSFLSGTSMACPHVSGIVANVKSRKPSWSPSAIRSAIMTTAIPTNNLKAPITTQSGSIATPFEIGAGEVSLSGPFHPGLVYETEAEEYLQFLCNSGYNVSLIKLISSAVPEGFSCSGIISEDLISNLNYPSIAISDLQAGKSKTVKRTARNVANSNSTYTVTVDTPTGLQVKVTPTTLQFEKRNQKLSYEVTFTANVSPKEDMFGSITWTSGKHKVRSPFVVNGN